MWYTKEGALFPMTDYYPLFMNIKDKLAVVVGGGTVAYRKVQTLLDYQARVRLVSPQVIPPLMLLVDDQRCSWSLKEYSLTDLEGAALVFACTDKEDVNNQVALDAEAASCPVNVVSDPEKCSFIVPSIFNNGDLSIAVSTAGSSPFVAQQIRMQLEEQYGDPMMAEYLDLLKTWRPQVKRRLTEEKRRVFWKEVTDGAVLKMIKANRLKEAKGVVEQCFQSLLA
jgi:precorrin-2 dehydrogenase/sirohydrochlorin ferrochelatase